MYCKGGNGRWQKNNTELGIWDHLINGVGPESEHLLAFCFAVNRLN